MCPVPKSPESRLSSRNSGTSYKLTSAGGQAGCRTSNPRHPRDSGRRSRGRGRTSPRNATFRGKSLRCSTARVPATPNRSHHRTPSGNRPVSYLLYIWPFHRQSQVGTVRPQQMAVAQLRTSAQHDTHVVYDAVVVRVQRRVLRKRIGKPSRHFAYEACSRAALSTSSS